MKGLLKTTNWQRKYWKERKIDWQQAYFTPDHPHRQLIISALKQFGFFKSVLELGCAAGANIYKIKQNFPHVDVGGIDWSADAIETAKKFLPRATVLQVGEAQDIYISSGGADIILTDMCLIYLSGKDFRKALREFKRVARVGLVLCEFHRESWFERLGVKILTGYNSYDYRKELTRAGFHQIEITPLTIQDWPDTEKEKGLRCIITAR